MVIGAHVVDIWAAGSWGPEFESDLDHVPIPRPFSNPLFSCLPPLYPYVNKGNCETMRQNSDSVCQTSKRVRFRYVWRQVSFYSSNPLTIHVTTVRKRAKVSSVKPDLSHMWKWIFGSLDHSCKNAGDGQQGTVFAFTHSESSETILKIKQYTCHRPVRPPHILYTG